MKLCFIHSSFKFFALVAVFGKRSIKTLVCTLLVKIFGLFLVNSQMAQTAQKDIGNVTWSLQSFQILKQKKPSFENLKSSIKKNNFRGSVMESFNRREHVVARFLDVAFDNAWHNGLRCKIFMLDLPQGGTPILHHTRDVRPEWLPINFWGQNLRMGVNFCPKTCGWVIIIHKTPGRSPLH